MASQSINAGIEAGLGNFMTLAQGKVSSSISGTGGTSNSNQICTTSTNSGSVVWKRDPTLLTDQSSNQNMHLERSAMPLDLASANENPHIWIYATVLQYRSRKHQYPYSPAAAVPLDGEYGS